jgi:hypothetical protein
MYKDYNKGLAWSGQQPHGLADHTVCAVAEIAE